MRSPGSARGAWKALAVLMLLAAGCAAPSGDKANAADGEAKQDGKALYTIAEADTAGLDQAIFAGGCFWCTEKDFQELDGVHTVISGYVGGAEDDPTYEQVSYGRTSHTEAILVTYDPDELTYEQLLQHFWVNHDPTTNDRQFCDRGNQYRPGIFYLDDTQRAEAEASVEWAKAQAKFNAPILTEITQAGSFWPAEVYHQDFWKKSPARYYSYRAGCGRDGRLEELWGKRKKS